MLRISVVTNVDTTSWVVGSQILSVFTEENSRLIPEVLFQWEDKVADFESVAACEKYWGQKATMRVQGSSLEFPIGLRWKRKKVLKYDAEIKHAYTNLKGDEISGVLTFYSKFNNKIEWLDVFRAACLGMKACYASMHIFTENEVVNYEQGGGGGDFFSGTLNKGKVPDIGWAAFFGDDIFGSVDPSRIADAGYSIEKIVNGYLVAVTKDLQDVENNFSFFSERRAELKKLFPEGFFLSQENP